MCRDTGSGCVLLAHGVMIRKARWVIVPVTHGARLEETTPVSLLEFCVSVALICVRTYFKMLAFDSPDLNRYMYAFLLHSSAESARLRMTIEKAGTVAPPYTERTRRRADAALECSRNAYMYQFKSGESKASILK